ncbi:MAG: VRR-NUC domain-containing protein, partial [Candidatus Competibacterales bacterium]|nr:VRR-NUC domain-containing protein [Candidatus Competibacterales bacterium]
MTAPVTAPDRRDEEHQHQVALIAWRDALREHFPQVGLLFAIPNGGLRRPRTAGRLKAEGAQDGVPDLLLPVPAAGAAGLFIEMKSSVGRLSARQRWWAKALSEEGYRMEVARRWTEACALDVD